MRSSLLAFACLLTITANLHAHPGARIWLDVDNNKVSTLTSDNDLNPMAYSTSRIFTTTLDQLIPGVWASEFPGYEVRRTGSHITGAQPFSFSITGPLLYFEQATQSYKTTLTKFGTPAPQFSVADESTEAISSTGAVAGFNFFNFGAIGDHAHMAYTLLGNGVSASDGPAGVYALPLSIQITGQNATQSDTFYLLLGKETAIGTPMFNEAIATAQSTLVPEPSMVMLAPLAGLLLARRNRSRPSV